MAMGAVVLFNCAAVTAAGAPSCDQWDALQTTCTVAADVPRGTEEGSGSASGPSNVASVERVCRHAGHEIPCHTVSGSWSPLVNAWCELLSPQPPKADVVWRNQVNGAIYLCTGPNGSLVPDPGMAFLRWLPGAPDAVTRADAEAAARRVLASLGLTAIDLGIHPRGDTVERMGYVGWHMWLWAESPSDRQWGPVEARASDSGISVSLSARVAEVTWDMGNGDSVTCQRGTAWSEARTQGGRNVASPDCGYVYAEDGRYTVTATSEWAVDWSAAGYTGTLPLTLSRSADVIVGELQSVAVGG